MAVVRAHIRKEPLEEIVSDRYGLKEPPHRPRQRTEERERALWMNRRVHQIPTLLPFEPVSLRSGLLKQVVEPGKAPGSTYPSAALRSSSKRDPACVPRRAGMFTRSYAAEERGWRAVGGGAGMVRARTSDQIQLVV